MAGGLAEKISKWVLTNGGESGNIRLVREAGALCAGIEYGGIAQLGERLNGIQEVSGSIPLISTTRTDWCKKTVVIERLQRFFF